MKGIIIAGGTGSRLDPLTRVTNKNLLPIYNKPLIYYPIETMKECGINDIMIVSGKGHAGQFLELLKSGEELGVKISYTVQEEPKGIAQALGLCEDFADEDHVMVMLGDNIYEDNKEIKEGVKSYKKHLNNFLHEFEGGAMVFLKEVPDPERFGVAELRKNKNGSGYDSVKKIIEKPQKPKTNLAVTGTYLYDKNLWKKIKTLKPSNRGELEITDVNNKYVHFGEMMCRKIKGWWIDAGTFDSMLKASVLIAQKNNWSLEDV